jgi:hypothetical protein
MTYRRASEQYTILTSAHILSEWLKLTSPGWYALFLPRVVYVSPVITVRQQGAQNFLVRSHYLYVGLGEVSYRMLHEKR